LFSVLFGLGLVTLHGFRMGWLLTYLLILITYLLIYLRTYSEEQSPS